MKTIAVDIDEVLARHNHALARFHNERYGTNHSEDDYFTDHWSKVWGVNLEEAERRAVEFHDTSQHASLEVVPGAFEVLRELKKTHRLVVVTVRRKQIIDITHRWLLEFYPEVFNDVKFIHFWDKRNTKTKAEVCQDIGANWLIDDNIKHVSHMRAFGKKGLLFGDYAWNQAEVLPEDVVRVKNWKAVSRYFSEVR